MKKNIELFLLILISIFSLSVKGQQTKLDSFLTNTPFSMKGSFQIGNVVPTNDFVRGVNLLNDEIDAFNSISLLMLKQTKGDKLWEQLFGYPVYGIGFYSALFKETKELGVPISVYGYLSAPFVRFSKLSFNYELGLGMTFNWKNFNPITNPYNIAISAEQSVYIEAGINLDYQIAKRYFFSAGYGFNHFSNGKLQMPNQGLNTKAVKLSLRYKLNNPSYIFEKREVPEYHKNFELDIAFYGGAENVTYKGNDVDIITKYEGLFFPVYGVNSTFNSNIGYKSKIGAGFSLGYNGALNAQIAVENGDLEEVDLPFGNHLTLSIYPSYELVMNRLSFVLQPGFYLYRKKSDELTPVFYQRIGENIISGMTILPV